MKTAIVYSAKLFSVPTVYGSFRVAGTICGNIDIAVPQGHTLCLSQEEAVALARALMKAKDDVFLHSRPDGDPRLVDRLVWSKQKDSN